MRSEEWRIPRSFPGPARPAARCWWSDEIRPDARQVIPRQRGERSTSAAGACGKVSAVHEADAVTDCSKTDAQFPLTGPTSSGGARSTQRSLHRHDRKTAPTVSLVVNG